MKKNLVFLFAILIFSQVGAQSAIDEVKRLRQEIIKSDSSRYPWLFALLADQSQLLTPDQDIEEAKETLNTAAQLDPVALIYAYRNLGNAYLHAKRIGEGLSYLQKAYDLSIENNRRPEMGSMALRLGLFYFGQEFFTEALEKLYEAGRIFISLNDTENLFKTYYTSSLINYRTKHYADAINEAKEANRLFGKMKHPLKGDSIDLMSANNTIGLAAFQLKNYDLSLQAFEQSERIAKELKNEFWIGLINGNRAKIYRAQGFVSMAIQNLKRDLAISVKFKEWTSASSSATTLADIYIDEHKHQIAKRYLDTASSLIQQVTSLRVKLNEAKVRTRYYEELNDLPNALRIQKKIIQFNDSLAVENEQINLGRFRARYELEKKQNEIASLKHSNELQQTKIDNQSVVIWSAGIILGLVFLLVLVIVRDGHRMKSQYALISAQRTEIENKNDELEAQSQTLQEQNQLIGSINLKLEEKVKTRTEELDIANKELDRFLYHASHDIRRPIATLLGLEQVFQLSGRETWQMLFEKVSDTAHSMDSMLFKLHMAYELNRPTGERYEINLHDCIDSVAHIFDSEFQRRNIDYIHIKNEFNTFSSNKELMQVILRNLIENSVYFRRPHIEERPFVRINSFERDGIVTIEIEDNGMGINPLYTDRIFDLYFRGTQQSKGNGVGLYLAMKAATMLGGSIDVQSEWGTGSVFRVHLPLIS